MVEGECLPSGLSHSLVSLLAYTLSHYSCASLAKTSVCVHMCSCCMEMTHIHPSTHKYVHACTHARTHLVLLVKTLQPVHYFLEGIPVLPQFLVLSPQRFADHFILCRLCTGMLYNVSYMVKGCYKGCNHRVIEVSYLVHPRMTRNLVPTLPRLPRVGPSD